ncbi:APC family permease [Mycoplasmopsis cricetuli]|uniref:APC family permease n=1 Tax=Mycoplasmopsis cricetuli TaxID=171283 RepID=UPI00046E94F8|nr:APC family permease [Mycoplasmopsis cricetuli]
MRAKNKLSEKNFIFFGINYIVGFGFVVTIANVISKGLWGMLIFTLTSFIALIVMLAFSKGTQAFGNEVGGSYVYSKKAFPKQKWFIFLTGWNQFAQIPLFAATTPLFISQLVSEFDKSNQLIYQICSIGIFIILSLLNLLGLKLSKWFILITAIFKWIILTLGFIIVIYFLITSGSITNVFQTNEKISISIIASSVLSFFYAFGGIEGLAGISSDIETKRFRKLLFLIFLIVFVFYFIFYLIFIWIDTTNIITKETSFTFNKIFKITFGITGSILFIIGGFFRNFTSTLSSNIYYSRIIVSLAQDNFIPNQLAKKAKNNEYKNAIYFSTFSSIISMIIFGIIPYYLNLEDQFASILNAGIIVFFMQYLLAIFSILVLSFKKTQIQTSIFEKFLYIIGIILIGFIILLNLFPPIVGENYQINSLLILISYFSVILIGFFLWWSYSFYKKRKNLKSNCS